VTVDELVTAVKGGTGMGTLFKQYGKPALLGVGHVKKALKTMPTAVVDDGTTTTTVEAEGVTTHGKQPKALKTPKPNRKNK
jgi:hypothetical protein